MLTTVADVARGQQYSAATRLAALQVLAGYVAPGFVVTPDLLRAPPGEGRMGIADHVIQVETSTPITPDDIQGVRSLFASLASHDPDQTVKGAADHLVRSLP